MDAEVADTLEALCNLIYLARTAGDHEKTVMYLDRAQTLLQALVMRIPTMAIPQTPDQIP